MCVMKVQKRKNTKQVIEPAFFVLSTSFLGHRPLLKLYDIHSGESRSDSPSPNESRRNK